MKHKKEKLNMPIELHMQYTHNLKTMIFVFELFRNIFFFVCGKNNRLKTRDGTRKAVLVMKKFNESKQFEPQIISCSTE